MNQSDQAKLSAFKKRIEIERRLLAINYSVLQYEAKPEQIKNALKNSISEKLFGSAGLGNSSAASYGLKAISLIKRYPRLALSALTYINGKRGATKGRKAGLGFKTLTAFALAGLAAWKLSANSSEQQESSEE